MKQIWAPAYHAGYGPLQWPMLVYGYGKTVWLTVPAMLILGGSQYLAPAYLLAGVAVLGLVLAAIAVRRPPPAALRWITWWLLAFVAVTAIFYAVAMSDSQRWYGSEPFFVFTLLGAGWLAHALGDGGAGRRPRLEMRLQLAAFAVAALLVLRCTLLTPMLYPWQYDVYRSQSAFASQVPEGERIGCFNAGIPGYFYDDVIDLDGLVNYNVVPYWRAHQFAHYLQDANVHYVADEIDSIKRAAAFSTDPFTLVAIASVALRGSAQPTRTLYRVETLPVLTTGGGPSKPSRQPAR
jgi:hypothetical protein